MKKTLALSMLFYATSLLTVAQTDFAELEKKGTFESVISTPEFPGQPKLVWPKYDRGKEGLDRYISANVKQPTEEQGLVVLSYVIDTRGQVVDIGVESRTPELLNEDLIKVIKSSGPWIPGTKDGKLLRMRLSISYEYKAED